MPSTQQKPSEPSGGDYQGRLQELVRRIRSNSQLILAQFNEYPIPPSSVFRKIEKTFNGPLPAEMVDFYSTLNGFKLVWRTQPEVVPNALGLVDILPVEQAFGGERANPADDWDDRVTLDVLWSEDLKESAPADFEAIQNKRVFDRHLGRNQVIMELNDGTVRFFYYVDGGVEPLSVSFQKLIDTVFTTAGIEYYPELLRVSSEAPDTEFLRELEIKVRLVNSVGPK